MTNTENTAPAARTIYADDRVVNVKTGKTGTVVTVSMQYTDAGLVPVKASVQWDGGRKSTVYLESIRLAG